MTQITIPPYRIEAAWLIGARSYLVDRFVPDCERIHLPAKDVAGGRLEFDMGPLPAPAAPPMLTRLRRGRVRSRPTSQAELIDLRRNSPSNWAHFLNNHLPITFAACTTLGIDPARMLLVLPAQTPSYIRAAADTFGLKVLATDDTLEGTGVIYNPDPWTSVRAIRSEWVKTPYVETILDRIDGAGTSPLPRRVFLSRKDSRIAENADEIAAWLAPMGFETVYPETLSASDQIRLFRQAEIMVAIHGAGLAPLLYAPAQNTMRHLIEILPCGHITDVYRVMAQQVGWNWIGVRGTLKPEYVQPAYDFSTPFKAYSLDSFSVDLTALKEAFALAGLSELQTSP